MAYSCRTEDPEGVGGYFFKNLDGIEVFLKTAANRTVHLKTLSPQIRHTESLFMLIPIKATAETPDEALTSLRAQLIFSLSDFPIQVSFKLNSGSAGINPPGGNYGLITSLAADYSTQPLYNWGSFHHYELNKEYTADPIRLQKDFFPIKTGNITLVLMHRGLEFNQRGKIFPINNSLERLPHSLFCVIFKDIPSEMGEEDNDCLIVINHHL